MRKQWRDPPLWSREELERDSAIAVERMISNWHRTERYRKVFIEARPTVAALFEATADLLSLTAEGLAEQPSLVAPARYLTAPVISADDLATLSGGRPGASRLDPEHAGRIAAVLRASLDPFRYPWLDDPAGRRRPTDVERRTAIDWTTGLIAASRVSTAKRMESSSQQEAATAKALKAAGYRLNEGPLPEVSTIDDLRRGCFARETILAGAKCDVPVRLRDGRLLAIECKVSNSAINSVKRLNRETAGKASKWSEAFGSQAVTAAVLAGVYKLTNLVQAQGEQGVTIFWEHDLQPLIDFVTAD